MQRHGAWKIVACLGHLQFCFVNVSIDVWVSWFVGDDEPKAEGIHVVSYTRQSALEEVMCLNVKDFTIGAEEQAMLDLIPGLWAGISKWLNGVDIWLGVRNPLKLIQVYHACTH